MIKINSFSSFFVANWKLNGDFKFIDKFVDNLGVPNNTFYKGNNYDQNKQFFFIFCS